MLFDRKKLRMSRNPKTGIILCRYGWKDIPYMGDRYYGCRHHFVIGNYWLKAEWSEMLIRKYKGSPFTQAQNEVWFYKERLEKQDRKYFVELVDHTIRWKSANIHWTVWPRLQLREADATSRAAKRCAHIVAELCEKYTLSDVESRINSNWFVMPNNQPLIVDVGLADYCRSSEKPAPGTRQHYSSGPPVNMDDCSCDDCQERTSRQ